MISGTANRKLSDEDGLVVPLCSKCHTMVHENPEWNRASKQYAERKWMEFYGKTEEDFLKRYGKSFLGD